MKTKKAFQLHKNKISSLECGDFEHKNFQECLLSVYPIEISTFDGFGGAFTESSCIQYSLMNKKQKEEALDLIFGENGLCYSYARISIGSCDFSTSPYSYIERDDFKNNTFSIEHDLKDIIPFLQDALRYTNGKLKIIASPWSPPAHFKTNNSLFNGGKLKKGFYGVYADYLIKFVQEYSKYGVNIYALTLQNEALAAQPWESCIFSSEVEVEFANLLADKRDLAGLKFKILSWDHNKERLINKAVEELSATDKIDGLAYHWYSGHYYDSLYMFRKMFPNKLLIETEFAFGTSLDFERHRYEVLNNISHGSNAIIEWCTILDKNGGPFHNRTIPCVPSITFNGEKLIKSITYNQMYMFSHFIKPGAKILFTSTYHESVDVLAAENPNNEMVFIALNKCDEERHPMFFFNDEFLKVSIPPQGLIVVITEKEVGGQIYE